MAKMAYFSGAETYLWVPRPSPAGADVLGSVGANEDWKITYNTILTETGVDGVRAIWAQLCYHGEYKKDTTVISAKCQTNDRRIYTDPLSLAPYTIECGRVSGRTYIKVDGTEEVFTTSYAGALNDEEGIWEDSSKRLIFGIRYTTGLEGFNNYFKGYVSNFQVWRNFGSGELVKVLDLPLREDFNDVSSYGHTINNVGGEIVDVELPLTPTSTIFMGYSAGEGWATNPIPLTVAGDITSSAGLSKVGTAILFTLDAGSIPQGSTVQSATLSLTGFEWEAPAGGVSSKICGAINPASVIPADVAAYQVVRGTDCGGASNANRTVAEVTWDEVTMVEGVVYPSPDISSVLTEIATYGDITGLLLFFDDHDGLSSMDEYLNSATSSVVLEYTLAPPVTSVTVTYNGNGNTSGTAPSDATEYEVGATVTALGIADMLCTNKMFAGWNTAADGTGTWYAIGSTFVITENTTLYATWRGISTRTGSVVFINPDYKIRYDWTNREELYVYIKVTLNTTTSVTIRFTTVNSSLGADEYFACRRQGDSLLYDEYVITASGNYRIPFPIGEAEKTEYAYLTLDPVAGDAAVELNFMEK